MVIVVIAVQRLIVMLHDLFCRQNRGVRCSMGVANQCNIKAVDRCHPNGGIDTIFSLTTGNHKMLDGAFFEVVQ